MAANLTFVATKQVWRFDRRTNPAETGLGEDGGPRQITSTIECGMWDVGCGMDSTSWGWDLGTPRYKHISTHCRLSYAPTGRHVIVVGGAWRQGGFRWRWSPPEGGSGRCRLWITFPRLFWLLRSLGFGFWVLCLYKDWFEGAVAQPQIVLQEMLGIVNPNFTHKHYFFRNVAQVRLYCHTPSPILNFGIQNVLAKFFGSPTLGQTICSDVL